MSDLYDYLETLMADFRKDFQVDPADKWPARKYLWRHAVAVFEFTRTLTDDGKATTDTAINDLRVIALDAGLTVSEIEHTLNSARRRIHGNDRQPC
jgi:hypothetical protein